MLPILVRDQFTIKVNLDKADWAPSISLTTTDTNNRIYINGKSYKNSTLFNILIDDYIKVYTNKNKLTYIKINMGISKDVTINNINYFKPRNIWLDASFLKQFPNLETFIFGHYAYGTTNPLLIGKFTGDWAKYIGPKLKSLTIGCIDYGPGTDCIFNANNIPNNSIIEEIILAGYSGFFKANMNSLVDLANLPMTLTKLILGWGATNNNDINYTTGQIPNNILRFNREGTNDISGDLINLNDNLELLTVYGSNTLTGKFKPNWKDTLEYLDVNGNNTISELLPVLNVCTYIQLIGNNTISYLPEAPLLNVLVLRGNNTVSSFDFNKYPKITRFQVTCLSFNGSIDLSPLTGNNINFEVNFGNLTSVNFGDTSKYISLRFGNNTINELPSEFINVVNFTLGGNNTVSELPNLPNVKYLYLFGNNINISGNILLKTPKVTDFRIGGGVNFNTYSQMTFSNGMYAFLMDSGSLTTDMVDQLLIDLSKATWVSSNPGIRLKGNNQARSSVSDSAVALLKTKGVNVDVWDLDTKKIINYANTNNYVLPSANHLEAINNLIIGMKTCGIWNLLDRFWLFSGDGSTDFKRINIINPAKTRADFYGGLTINNFGIQGNGTNAYVDTNFNPALLESGQKYQLDNACHGGIVYNYPTSENSTSSYSPLTGTIGSEGQNSLYLRPGVVSKINQNSSNLDSTINISGTGLKLINRNNSSSVYFINKASKIDRNVNSTSIFNIKQFGLRGAVGYANIGVNCLMMGASIPFQVSQDFRTVFNTYLLAIGQAQIA